MKESQAIERAGMITASQFSRIRTLKSGAWTDGARTYMAEVISERLTGIHATHTGTTSIPALQWGEDKEPEARAEYAWVRGIVRPHGFVLHATLPKVGGSPDGVTAEGGIVEIKCPWTCAKHARVLGSQEIPKEYLDQCIGNLWVTQAPWIDFVSYDPRFPDGLRLAIVRLQRTPEIIDPLAARVRDFSVEVDKREAALKEKIRGTTRNQTNQKSDDDQEDSAENWQSFF